MTTKFLDNKIFTFKFLLSWRFPRKIAFWRIFLSAPLPTPPLKNANFIFIVVSLSLIIIGNEKSARSFSDRSFFMDVRAGYPFRNACFPGFAGPDRSFWRDVRRDVRPKTSSLGWILFSLEKCKCKCNLVRIIIRGVAWEGGTGLDTYQICIQARFDTYQNFPFWYRKYRERPFKRAPNATFRLVHVCERKLCGTPLSIIPI